VKQLKLTSLWLILCLLGPWPSLADNTTEAIENQERKARFAKQRINDWHQLIDNHQDKTDQQKLEYVNAFFNTHVQFLDDQALWKKKDYWATPIETLTIGGGDCEDYAIAKYITLKRLGIDEEKLRLTYVKAIEINQAHMVLTYFENKRAIPFVLDNLIIDIKPANERNDLLPVYSFNGSGLWLSGRQDQIRNSTGLSLWQDLLLKVQQGK